MLHEKVFLSYRGRDIDLVWPVGEYLHASGFSQTSAYIKPHHLCADRELLTTYEHFELMCEIGGLIKSCDGFVVLDRGDHAKSYWTQMELLHWRRVSKSREIHKVRVGRGNEFRLAGSSRMPPLSRGEAAFQAHVMTVANRDFNRMPAGLPQLTGRYAKSCYVVGCGHCKKHFLLSRSVTDKNIGLSLECPHCSGSFRIESTGNYGRYYRNQLQLARFSGAPPVPDSELLFDLLFSNETQPPVPLVSASGDYFPTDLTKIARGWLIGGAAVLGAMAIWDALASDDD